MMKINFLTIKKIFKRYLFNLNLEGGHMKNLLAIILLTLTACVSTPKFVQPEFKPAKTIERIGGLDKTPEWAKGVTTFTEVKGNLIYINTITMSGDSRPEACLKVAANSGRVKILREIKDNISSTEQFTELSTDSDPAIDTLITFLSQGALTGVKVGQQYWEKNEVSDTNGFRVLKLNCSVQVQIPKKHLVKQINNVILGSKKGHSKVKEKLMEAHEKFIESVDEN